MIWSLWPRMIQFNPPNHVQKTNQKNRHISAGKHPFDTFKVHKVCQLLCLETQTSEHGTKGSFITSDLRAFDVEFIFQRREILQSCDVSAHIGVDEAEVCQLVRFFRASRSPETWFIPRSRNCRSGNSLKRGLRVPVTSRCRNRSIFTTLQPFLGWETPRRGRRSHGSRLCWQIFYRKFCCVWKFSVSISFYV